MPPKVRNKELKLAGFCSHTVGLAFPYNSSVVFSSPQEISLSFASTEVNGHRIPLLTHRNAGQVPTVGRSRAGPA